MRHGIVTEGAAYRLRPVRVDDAEFIYELRRDPWRNRYLHRGAESAEAQRRWLEEYFARPGDYYFIIEARATGCREGTAGIYNLDPEERTAEWGRWVVRPESLAAVESTCLVYRTVFEALDLDAVYCRTIAENSSALAFHDSFGLERRRVLPAYLEVEGCWLDAIESWLTRARWRELRADAETKAQRVAGWKVA